MNDENYSEDKPSFFDSNDESTSWPPADNYEIENTPTDNSSSKLEQDSAQSFFDTEDFSDALSRSDSSNNDVEEPEETNFNETKVEDNADVSADDFLDDLISDIDDPTSSNKMRIVDDEPDEEETSFEADLVIEPEATSEEESFIQEIPEPPEYLEQTETETSDDDFDLDDLISEDTSEPEPEIISEPDNSDLVQEDTSFDSSTTEEFTSDFNDSIEDSFQDATDYSAVNDYAQSDFVDIIDEYDQDEELKPFRAFTKINLAEELAEENEEEEEAGGIFAGMNRNIIIILAVILLSLGYFLFTTFFNRTVETRSRRTRRPPRKEQISSRVEQILTPVWEVTDQTSISPAQEAQYAKSLISFTGRENPFAMPQSVIDALKRRADLELLSKEKPNTYKRLAYRATLLGVLTSEGSTIALINMQEADFDVIEGTTKNKVLKLATKTMNKAKTNTLEMVTGGFIGPWEIVKISTPKGAFTDAKVTVEFQGTQKVLNMGKAEDLGIFDLAGQIDDLETSSNAEDEDDSDDDF